MEQLMLRARILILAVASASLAVEGGELYGQIRVTRKLTRKRISLPQVYERNVSLAARQPEAGELGELNRVVIFVEGVGSAPKPITATMNQTHRSFEPEVLAVPVGSTVQFPNGDPVFHNVFSLSRTKKFDLGSYPKGQSRSVRFSDPGIVSVHCHLHPNMSGAIVVIPSNWYTHPAPDGTFRITGLPPGTYELVAWHRSAGSFRRRVRVEPDDTGYKPIDFEIPITVIPIQNVE